MNRFPVFRAAFVILMTLGYHADASLENRVDSLGPLKRYNPDTESPQFILKTHGKPGLGLPTLTGERLQRVSDRIWYLDLNGRIARMEPDYNTGEVALKDVIEASRQWCVSPDGKLIFAGRRSGKTGYISECFDLATGEPKWTFEKTLFAMDVCFTPDGKQVAVLHNLPNPPRKADPNQRFETMSLESRRKLITPVSAAVSWHDAQSGELVRRVVLPRGCRDSCGDFMAFSGDRLYVTLPGNDSGGECFVIKPGATKPEKIEIEVLGHEKKPCVEVGGLHGEFVAFRGEFNVVLFRQEADGTLVKLAEQELEGTSDGNPYEATDLISLPADWHLRPENALLSSDGRWIVVIPVVGNQGSALAVIDVDKQQIVHSQPLKWMPTSLSISADGKRLLVGSSNRAVYEFDFLKMTGSR